MEPNSQKSITSFLKRNKFFLWVPLDARYKKNVATKWRSSSKYPIVETTNKKFNFAFKLLTTC